VERAGIELAPVDGEQLGIARRAFGRFGKGRRAAGLDAGTREKDACELNAFDEFDGKATGALTRSFPLRNWE